MRKERHCGQAKDVQKQCYQLAIDKKYQEFLRYVDSAKIADGYEFLKHVDQETLERTNYKPI